MKAYDITNTNTELNRNHIRVLCAVLVDVLNSAANRNVRGSLGVGKLLFIKLKKNLSMHE